MTFLSWKFTIVISLLVVMIFSLLFVFLGRFKIQLQYRLLFIGLGILIGDFFILAHYFSWNSYIGFDLFFMSFVDTAKMINLDVSYKDILETFTFRGENKLKILFCIYAMITPLLWGNFIMIIYSVIKDIFRKSK